MVSTSPTQPHAYKGYAPIGDRCTYGIHKGQAGVSCGRPQDDPIHHPDLAAVRPAWVPYGYALHEGGETTWYAE